MPYTLEGNCVKKKDTGETVKCHDTHEEALAHFRALQMNVKDSSVVEMSMRITKASYNKSEPNAMRWAAIDSDTEDDLYHEKMSAELYQDFVSRIENKTPIPEPFAEVICEDAWCGGMPYLSIAHYKAGTGAVNVPGTVESVYIDGNRLKSKGVLHNNDMGRAVWEKLREDMYIKQKSQDTDHLPVRISIGFLDLEHKHLAQNGGQEFVFTRKSAGELCPMCAQGIGGKIYMKGQLVHLAMTRVPVNPRTAMEVERSMDEITSKRQDAESIIGDLANDLEEKSIASGLLVVRADGGDGTGVGSLPTSDDLTTMCKECYDPNLGKWNQDCVNKVYDQWMVSMRDNISEDTIVKSRIVDEVIAELARRKDVSPADKKRAEKEYGDVEYADEANKKYPLDKEHIHAAISYWGMPKNRAKYSPEEQKKIGARIYAAAKKFGIDVSKEHKSVVEEAMAKEKEKDTEKEDGMEEESVLGIPEKPFSYAGLDGEGNNNIPNPVKAKKGKEDDEEAGEDDTKGDEEKEDEMKKSFVALSKLVKSGASVEQINEAFGNLGTAVEKSYADKKQANTGGLDANAIAEIVRSSVQQAVAPLHAEIATLKSKLGNGTVSTDQVVKSKALNLNNQYISDPQQLIQRAVPQQPQRKLTKIEEIAYRSTGAIK